MLKVITFLFAAFYVITLTGCDRDTIIIPEIPVNTSEGAYVLSEGGSTGPGILSFYNLTIDSFYNNIMNNSMLYPDGLFIEGNDLYVIEQGNFGSAGNIYLCDTNGNIRNSRSVGTNPYSMTIANNKIYITNGHAGNVSVLNKPDLSLITTIPVGLYPQEILSIGNKVFVCNTFFSGSQDSTVSVIDANLDEVIFTVRVRYVPSSLEVTNDNKLLVSCPGPGFNPQGIIYKIDPDNYNKLDSFIINDDGVDKDLSVDKESNFVYFISGNNNIARLNLQTKFSQVFIPNPSIGSAFFYGYKYDSKNKKHYIADAINFQINGRFLIYNSSGNLEKSFTTGLAPRRIALKGN